MEEIKTVRKNRTDENGFKWASLTASKFTNNVGKSDFCGARNVGEHGRNAAKSEEQIKKMESTYEIGVKLSELSHSLAKLAKKFTIE